MKSSPDRLSTILLGATTLWMWDHTTDLRCVCMMSSHYERLCYGGIPKLQNKSANENFLDYSIRYSLGQWNHTKKKKRKKSETTVWPRVVHDQGLWYQRYQTVNFTVPNYIFKSMHQGTSDHHTYTFPVQVSCFCDLQQKTTWEVKRRKSVSRRLINRKGVLPESSCTSCFFLSAN